MDKKEKLLKEWNGGIARGAQRKLADKLKLNEASVSSWLSGRAAPSESNLLKMSKIFNKDLTELEDIFVNDRRAGAALTNGNTNGADSAVPVYTATPNDNATFILTQTAEAYLPIKKPAVERAFAIKITGDSMLDADNPRESLYEGDYLIFLPNAQITDGALVLARINKNYCVIRRFYQNGNIIELAADNPKHKTLKLDLYNAEILAVAAHTYKPAGSKPRRK